MAMTAIYRIMTAADHAALLRDGQFGGSALDRADGFIHMSTADQVAGTLATHYAGVAGLMLLSIDAGAVAKELRWESARGGALFPHLYRPLRMADVLATAPVPIGAEGTHLPPLP